MTEPDVDALIAWHEEAARRLDGPGLGQTGDYHTKAATALRTLQERCKSLERERLSQINSLILIAREARSSGNRTFDQCIDALAHIDDFCRAQLTGDNQ